MLAGASSGRVRAGTSQFVRPWAAAKSGQSCEHAEISPFLIMGPPAHVSLTVAKTASPDVVSASAGTPVTYLVTFTNGAGVAVVLNRIADILLPCMSISCPIAAGSQVTGASSASHPEIGAAGTVSWGGEDLGRSPDTTWNVRRSGRSS